MEERVDPDVPEVEELESGSDGLVAVADVLDRGEVWEEDCELGVDCA